VDKPRNGGTAGAVVERLHGRSIEPSSFLTEDNIGNYARSFEISSKIKQDAIGAELKDGVMTLVLPKAETAKARKIKVS
jgi:HSP20 family molecular chaperone IbpA